MQWCSWSRENGDFSAVDLFFFGKCLNALPTSVLTCQVTTTDSVGSEDILAKLRTRNPAPGSDSDTSMYYEEKQNPRKTQWWFNCSRTSSSLHSKTRGPGCQPGRHGTLRRASHRNTSAKTGTRAYGVKHAICTGSNSARWCINFYFFLFTSENTGLELFSEDLSSSRLNYSEVVFGWMLSFIPS